MHAAAMEWVRRTARLDAESVLDLGGRDVNGSPRILFPDAVPYRVLDVAPGPGVDIVADAAIWPPDRAYDLVLCCEVLEHAAAWRAILRTAYAALRPGGQFVATMAGPGREPHSAVDGGPLRDGEHYANIEPTALVKALTRLGFTHAQVDQAGPDVRCVATRPGGDA